MSSLFEECTNCHKKTSGSLFCSARCRSIIMYGTPFVPEKQGKKQGLYKEPSNAASANSISSVRTNRSANSSNSLFHFEYDSSRKSCAAKPWVTALTKPRLKRHLTSREDSSNTNDEQLKQYAGFFREAKESRPASERTGNDVEKRRSKLETQSPPAGFRCR